MAIALVPVVSSQIAAVGYDAATGELVVKFRSSGHRLEPTYSYTGVPPELAAGLVAAASPGSFFHRHIRHAGYPYRHLATADFVLAEAAPREVRR